MANIDGGLDVSRMYSYCDRTGIQMPLNIWPQQTGAGCAGDCLISFVDQWMDKTPSGKWANWMVGGVLLAYTEYTYIGHTILRN